MSGDMRWKIASAVLAMLLVATNAWHTYHFLDQAVTLAHRDQVLHEFANKVKATTTLASLVVKGKPEAEAIGLLKQLFPSEKHFVKEGTINSSWLSIKLGPGRVAQELEVDETITYWALPERQRE